MWQLGWDGLLTFTSAYQSQAEEVRSQAGVTKVVFHIFKKVKSKHTLKASLEKKLY